MRRQQCNLSFSIFLIFILIQWTVLSVAHAQTDEPKFEDIVPEKDEGIGVPDALGDQDSDIGVPDALDGSKSNSSPNLDDDIKMNLDLNSGSESGAVEESTDLSVPGDEEVASAPIELRSLRAPSGPNHDKEQYFNKVYRDYNERPLTTEMWSTLSLERVGESYTIQNADTLWDISRTFFGEGDYWPKVWSLNKGIKNPHLIEPQQQLLFFPGNINQEPRLELSGDAKIAEAQKEIEKKSPLFPKGVQIPAPKRVSRSSIKIPDSLPLLKTFTFHKQEISAPNIGLPFERPSNNQFEVTTFATEGLGTPIGEVVSVETGGKTASQYQYINVRFSGSPEGGAMMAIEVAGPVMDLNKEIEKPLGVIAQIQGTIRSTETVNSAKSIYRCMVTRSFNPIFVGSKIYSGSVGVQTIQRKSSPKQIGGQIIGGRFQSKRHLFGTGGIVFFNGGSNAGVAIGDVIGIVANPKVRNPNTQEVENFRLIGKIQAVHVSPGLTTGFVVEATEAIRVGDFSGSGPATFGGAAGGLTDDDGFQGDSETSSSGFDDTEQELGSELDDSFDDGGTESFDEDDGFGEESDDDSGFESDDEDSDFGDSDEDF